ncbi:hypothetical protein pb186bvf_004624 [Paramecium bursaria]
MNHVIMHESSVPLTLHSRRGQKNNESVLKYQMDVDLVQDLIISDLNHNHYFMEEHDIDFNIPHFIDEFFDCFDSIEEAPQFTHTKAKQQTQSLQQKNSLEEIDAEPDIDDRISMSSLDEIFQYQQDSNQYDVRTYQIDKKRVVSIFTLKSDFFESEQQNQLLIRNVELLKHPNRRLQPFYAHLRLLKLNIGTAYHKQSIFEIEFFQELQENLLNFQKMLITQDNFLELHPTLVMQNQIQSFCYHHDRFVQQANHLLEISYQKQITFMNMFKRQMFEESMGTMQTNFKIFDFYRTFQKQNEQIQLKQQKIIESSCFSIIQFKVQYLKHMYDHFHHLKLNSSRYASTNRRWTKLRSRYRMRQIFKDQILIYKKIRYTTQTIQSSQGLDTMEKYFSFQPNSSFIKGISGSINCQQGNTLITKKPQKFDFHQFLQFKVDYEEYDFNYH